MTRISKIWSEYKKANNTFTVGIATNMGDYEVVLQADAHGCIDADSMRLVCIAINRRLNGLPELRMIDGGKG